MTVNEEFLANVHKEATALRNAIGDFKTGEEFLDMARDLQPDKIKKIGLNINRLLKGIAELTNRASAEVVKDQFAQVPAETHPAA
jgi:hypothetical protein